MGTSQSTYDARRNRLIQADNVNAGIGKEINAITIIKNDLQQQIRSMEAEISELNNNGYIISRSISTNTTTKSRLTSNKDSLERDLETAKYLLKTVEQAIVEIKTYGRLQKRTQDFFDKEYDTLYNKIVNRQLLHYNNYINRNATLTRAIDKFNQKFSNDYVNTEYQEKHTAFFVLLNSIFWWIYYILCLVILYQLVYTQNEMNLQSKIILGIVLMLYPLSYRIYDLVVAKK